MLRTWKSQSVAGNTLTLGSPLLVTVASCGKQQVTWVPHHRVHPSGMDLGALHGQLPVALWTMGDAIFHC